MSPAVAERAEERLLVAATAPRRERAEIDAALAAGIDWHVAYELFDRHNAVPLLAPVALAAPAGPDAELAARLRVRRRRFACVDLASLEALRRILDALREAAIDVVVLKGATLAERFYDDPSTRVASDVDVLVHPDAREAAGQCLERLGFRAVDKASYEASHFHVPYRGADPLETVVELHWGLTLGGSEVRFDIGRFWARRRPVTLRAGAAAALAPADAFVHLCWHTFNHGTAPLRDLSDVMRLAAALDADDWEAVRDTSRRAGTDAFVALALRLGRELWGAPASIPSDLETAAPRWAGRRLLTARGALSSGDRLWWPLRSIAYWSLLPPGRDDWSSLSHRIVRDVDSPLTGMRAAAALVAALACCAAMREPWRVGLRLADGSGA